MKLFRLYIGSRHDGGVFSIPELREVITRTLQPDFPSFTLFDGEGWFRGVCESGLMVIVATDALPRLLDATARLRTSLRQEGIGVEFSSRYHRVTEGRNLTELAHEILNEGLA